MEGSTAWSDDSSIDESFTSRRPSDASTESYPVFVRSNSDDLSDLEEHPDIPSLNPTSEFYEKPRPPPMVFPPPLGDCSPRPPLWTGNRTGTNHYFREKKWDFFPELAPCEIQTANKFPPKPQKKDHALLNLGAFDFVRKGSRRNPGGRTLAYEMRTSIRSYVQRRLSKHSMDKEKSKRPPRPATAPSEYAHRFSRTHRAPSSNYTNYSDRGSIGPPEHSLDITDHMTRLSVSTLSSIGEYSPPVAAPHPKRHLAVPITPYQRYGAAIWEKQGRGKRVSYRQRDHVRFPRYRHQKALPPRAGFVSANTTPPLNRPTRLKLQKNTRECVRALHNGTSQVLVALDGARQRMIRARVDRRRKRLKAQIRLIGPVNPYTTYGRVDPWV
ncbi:hypothetical protein FE257_000463 [Aspergillus nanangensis]|uniref:Uncharacterized protein n=1 Tax=Aspergillus nanangensis TaxID=2582783 RepID=A0AAD4GWK5_ASPNN|nr:hypothetical protein FE257_000463 [Aspergillus nanangensis]